jgi:hypothetical protein
MVLACKKGDWVRRRERPWEQLVASGRQPAGIKFGGDGTQTAIRAYPLNEGRVAAASIWRSTDFGGAFASPCARCALGSCAVPGHVTVHDSYGQKKTKCRMILVQMKMLPDLVKATGNSPPGSTAHPRPRGDKFSPPPPPRKLTGDNLIPPPSPPGITSPTGSPSPLTMYRLQLLNSWGKYISITQITRSIQHFSTAICNCTAVHTTQSAQQHNHKINKF